MPAPSSITLAIAQLNPTVGDLAGNAAKILAAYDKAAVAGADLVICPELALIGYPPEDLVLSPAFRKKAMRTLRALAAKVDKAAALLIGAPWEEGGKVYNAAVLIERKKILHVQPKTCLPNYGIFDEKRLFAAGPGPKIARWRGIRLGVLICEDLWFPEPTRQLKKQGAELLIVINASPFGSGKLKHRRRLASRAAKACGAPIVYVNSVGGQDDIVFDGGSFAVSASGKPAVQLPEFSDAMVTVGMAKRRGHWQLPAGRVPAPLDAQEALWEAMKRGLRDYVDKNGFPGVVLGLSGGIDSALVAALAVDALGASRVHGVLLPSPYTSKESLRDAQETAALLDIETMTVPITPGMGVFREMLGPFFGGAGWMEDITLGGNLQARLRAVTLMAMSNRFGWMLLNTGNKSELAVGYTTLYGDLCGGYAPLKDLYKMQVYELARWRNRKGKAIPQGSLDRAPSAELAPGQKDEDQLPPYPVLDAILLRHIEQRLSADEIVAQGYAREAVEKVVKLVRQSEYKRRQSPPGPKLSPMLFGRDRRYPLTNKF